MWSVCIGCPHRIDKRIACILEVKLNPNTISIMEGKPTLISNFTRHRDLLHRLSCTNCFVRAVFSVVKQVPKKMGSRAAPLSDEVKHSLWAVQDLELNRLHFYKKVKFVIMHWYVHFCLLHSTYQKQRLSAVISTTYFKHCTKKRKPRWIQSKYISIISHSTVGARINANLRYLKERSLFSTTAGPRP